MNNSGTAFAPTVIDDKGTVKIQIDEDNSESYLLFTSDSMKKFSKLLTKSMDFEKEHNFQIHWFDRGEDDLISEGFGYKFEKWGMDKFNLMDGGIGDCIEHIADLFIEESEIEQLSWKNDPRNYSDNEVVWGYTIYHNLLNACKSKSDKTKEALANIEENVKKEIYRQKKGSFELMGRTYHVETSKQPKPCNNPIIIAGLCLLWPSLFFNIKGIGSMPKEDLRHPKLATRCKPGKCDAVIIETIWESKTDFSPLAGSESGFQHIIPRFIKKDLTPKARILSNQHIQECRAKIIKNICYCGKTNIAAKRWVTYTDNSYEEITIRDTTNLEIKEKIKDKKDDITKRIGPEIIGPKKAFDSLKFSSDETYRKEILEALLIDIFTKPVPKNGKKPLQGKELPLPKSDIRLIASKIIEIIDHENEMLKYFRKYLKKKGKKYPNARLHFKKEYERDLRNKERKENYLQQRLELVSQDIKISVDKKEIKQLRRTKAKIEKDLLRIREELLPLRPKSKAQTDSDRAAKHRLGVRIAEIGRLLQWWNDLDPIFDKLYNSDDKPAQSLLTLKEGISNVRDRSRNRD